MILQPAVAAVALSLRFDLLAARTIARADGIVSRTLALFSVLATADRDGILVGIRQAVEGQDVEKGWAGL